jgi:hypothetical protein
MPVMKRRSPLSAAAPDPNVFLIDDGTHGLFTGDDAYPDRESAGRAWRGCRREVWGMVGVGVLPQGARAHDHLSDQGVQYVYAHWNDEDFELDEALAAIAVDRAAVTDFQKRDPKGAASIADFLEQWRVVLDRAEVIARDYAARPASRREYPRWQNERGKNDDR